MRCRLVISPRGESLIRDVLAQHRLPPTVLGQLLDHVQFDLGADAEEKLQRCGERGERQYSFAAPNLGGRFWFQFEIDFDASPCEARILDFRFIPFIQI